MISRKSVVLLFIWIILTIIVVKFFRPDYTPKSQEIDKDILALNQKLALLEQHNLELFQSLQQKRYSTQKQITEEREQSNAISSKPPPEYETLRRHLNNHIQEIGYFVNSKIRNLHGNIVDKTSPLHNLLSNFYDEFDEHKRFMIKEVAKLSEVDEYNEWRINEHKRLSDLVQKRLHYIQNPKNCKEARKLQCSFDRGRCGFGCQLHHLVDCFIAAYATERTLILDPLDFEGYGESKWDEFFLPLSETCLQIEGEVSKERWPGAEYSEEDTIFYPYTYENPQSVRFLPLRIPEDLSSPLMKIHGDPAVWWVGQFMKYMLRPQPKLERRRIKYQKEIGFKSPIVGIHVRRTDKISSEEASRHELHEYMYHVEEYYKTLSLTRKIAKKRVYVATDDASVYAELNFRYPDYEVLGNIDISISANPDNRDTKISLEGIIMDIHMLSLTDYLVCTFSSRVCRVAYEIMNHLHYDGTNRTHSLDDIYFYAGQFGRHHYAVLDHKPNDDGDLELLKGDVILIAGNHWNGYSKGKNLRTGRGGLYPSFKTVNQVEGIGFPTYPQVS